MQQRGDISTTPPDSNATIEEEITEEIENTPQAENVFEFFNIYARRYGNNYHSDTFIGLDTGYGRTATDNIPSYGTISGTRWVYHTNEEGLSIYREAVQRTFNENIMREQPEQIISRLDAMTAPEQPQVNTPPQERTFIEGIEVPHPSLYQHRDLILENGRVFRSVLVGSNGDWGWRYMYTTTTESGAPFVFENNMPYSLITQTASNNINDLRNLLPEEETEPEEAEGEREYDTNIRAGIMPIQVGNENTYIFSSDMEEYEIDYGNIHTVEDVVKILQLLQYSYSCLPGAMNQEAKEALSQGILIKKEK